MQDLIKHMAEVANEMDEAGLARQASGVDQLARRLTSQIGGYAPGGIGGGDDDLEQEETGIDEEMQGLDDETSARVEEKRRLLQEKKRKQQQMATRPATLPTA